MKRSDTLLAPFEIIVNDCSLNNPQKIAQSFNKYFVKISQSIANSIDERKLSSFRTYVNNSVSQTIVLKPPSHIEIHNIINSLNLHRACVHDNISSYFLRVGNKVLVPVLSYYFSCVFELHFFLQIFKIAKVVPIYKSGNKKVINNYHPISLLSYLLKILEKLIKSCFDSFFIKHGVLHDFQYGFRQNHGVTHALFDVAALTYDSIQNKCYTALLLMDLRKAFDTVSSEIHLHKLQHYGIRGPAHTLIKSYFSSQKQFASIDNTSSSIENVEIGVPQSSILSPLLFFICTNNLCNALLSKPRLFAADTRLVLKTIAIKIKQSQKIV